jgi:hypothetical protein
MKQVTRCGWAVAVAALMVVGCDTPSDVLTSGAGLQTSDGSWVDWCPDNLPPFLEAAKLGNACRDAKSACAMNMVGFAPGCSWDWRGCIDGHVQAVTSYTIGCPATGVDASGGYWTSCVDALANGESGQACSFTGACTRATEDPCCLEVGMCPATGRDPSLLQRNRICAHGCSALSADTSQPLISTCHDAVAAAGKFGSPCEPGLVCFSNRGLEVDDPTGATFDNNLILSASVHWCANGLLMYSTTALETMF